MRAFGLMLVVLLTLTQGCGRSIEACTHRTGTNALEVRIAKALYVRTGYVELRVCDDVECARTVRRLGPLPRKAREPAPRTVQATFDALGRRFTAGPVRVLVRLHGPRGLTVAQRQSTVTLSHSYPNGQRCDGGGFVTGTFALRVSDRE